MSCSSSPFGPRAMPKAELVLPLRGEGIELRNREKWVKVDPMRCVSSPDGFRPEGAATRKHSQQGKWVKVDPMRRVSSPDGFRPEGAATRKPGAPPRGSDAPPTTSPEGAGQEGPGPDCLAPSGLGSRAVVTFPGRCPGLICSGPFGAKKDRLRPRISPSLTPKSGCPFGAKEGGHRPYISPSLTLCADRPEGAKQVRPRPRFSPPLSVLRGVVS
jgi:hypothetical protein